MKFSILISLFLASASIVQAQTTPTFPTVDNAFNQVKNVYLQNKESQLVSDYKISDLSKVKVLKEWEYEGQISKASFSAFPSDFMYDLYPFKNPKPNDRCHIYFVLETPKEADGTYYQVPIEVVYTRLKNDALTNQWEFYWFKLGYPTELGGNEFTTEQKINCLINTLQKTKIENGKASLTLINNEIVDLNSISNFYTITKINLTYDHRKSVNEYEVIYEIEGEGYYNLLDVKKEDQIKIATRIATIDAKITKEKTGWTITSMYINSKYAGDEKPKVEATFYGNIHEVGFDGIFQNKTAFNPPFYAEFNKQKLEYHLKDIFAQVYEDPEKNEKLLYQFFDENDPLSAGEIIYLLDLFKNLKSKCVDIYTDSEEKKRISFSERIESDFSFDKWGIVKIEMRLFRRNLHNDSSKSLKKKYKAAGMSDEILKQGGEFDNTLVLEFKCHVVNNYLYLTQVNRNMISNFTVPF